MMTASCGRARARPDPGSQLGAVGATSRPWVISPITDHGGTRGRSRARSTTAAAASAVSASPSRVVRDPARPARQERRGRSSRPPARAATARGPRCGPRGSSAARWTPADRAAKRSAGTRPRPRWPVSLHRCRRGVGPPRRHQGGQQQHVGDPAGRAAGLTGPQGHRGRAAVADSAAAGRAPTAEAVPRSLGRPGCRRPGRSRPVSGRRHGSSARGGGTAHERGLPPRPPVGANSCGPVEPAAAAWPCPRGPGRPPW
jgi:hypothetical protein